MAALEDRDVQQLLERRQLLQEQLEVTREQLAWYQRRWKAKHRATVADVNPHWNYSEEDCEKGEEWIGRVSFSPSGSHFLDPYGRAFLRRDGRWRPLLPHFKRPSAVAITDQGKVICKSSNGEFHLEDDPTGISFTNFHMAGNRIAASSGRLITVFDLELKTSQQFLWHTTIQALMFSHDNDHLIIKYGGTVLGCLHLASSVAMERIYGPLGNDQLCLAARRLQAESGESVQEAWWFLLYSPSEQRIAAFMHSKGKISSQVIINNVLMAVVSQGRLLLVESLGNLVSRALPNLRDSQLVATLPEFPTQLIVPGCVSRYVALQFRGGEWKFIILSY